MMQSRTHNCGQLRLADAGRSVKIVGWMENIREVSSALAFIVVRDFYGTTQVVAETEEMVRAFKAVTRESTISVEGAVRERASKNPKLPTGDIEIVPEKLEVLGRCRYNELPFQINRSREADEAARLRYRYLDLRNPEVKANIILRSKVISALRRAMEAQGFMEITTPILTVSSPEGARDYLVPARNHPGKFYALPQAPQQFKQLLMASGFDRYFQIAPCFRDEDARADRSPGEFYQLDMEMAFATQEDVFEVLEAVLPPIFAEYGKYSRASGAPFRRIPYLEALEKYGTDKPDLRIDLVAQDATELLSGCGFGPFEGQVVKAVAISGYAGSRKQTDKLCADAEVQSGNKAYWFRVDEKGEIVGGIAKFVQQLADRTNETVYITVPMGRCVYYLDAAYPGTSSTLFVGSIRYATGYMHATSSGKAMLASMPEEALKEYLRHPLEKSTDMTITEPEQLAAEIEEVRRRGYATDNMEMDVGINCVGVAIRDRKGDVVGALSVSGPSPRFYEERVHQIADMLKATVREIECKI